MARTRGVRVLYGSGSGSGADNAARGAMPPPLSNSSPRTSQPMVKASKGSFQAAEDGPSSAGAPWDSCTELGKESGRGTLELLPSFPGQIQASRLASSSRGWPEPDPRIIGRKRSWRRRHLRGACPFMPRGRNSPTPIGHHHSRPLASVQLATMAEGPGITDLSRA